MHDAVQMAVHYSMLVPAATIYPSIFEVFIVFSGVSCVASNDAPISIR